MKGGSLKLMWLHHQSTQDPLTDVQAQQHARGYILYMLGTTMFSDYSMNLVGLRWLPLLKDFDAYGAMSWGCLVLAFLYRELYKVATMQTSQF